MIERLQQAFGPLAAGALLDVVDLATFGPAGLSGGFLVGAAVGWWLGGQYGLSSRARAGLAIACAGYTALPSTELLPLGTLVGSLVRLPVPAQA